MNKIYKLVYNRILNQVVAVSEIANNNGKSSLVKPPVVEDASFHDSSVGHKKTLIAFALTSLFSILPMGIASASTPNRDNNVRSDQPELSLSNDASYNANLNYVSASGYNQDAPGIVGNAVVNYHQNVPVININNPDSNGVSDNRFSKFNTDTGVVFNNNDGSISLKASMLAKKIDSNPNLKNAAKVILAQVTGNDKSLIKGVMEVLGKKADLMIVNPNGIDLNGVSLVNIHDFTASTAEISSNNANNNHVTRGTININGDLSTDDVNVIRLIAKAIKVKATISTAKKGTKRSKIILSAGSQDYNINKDTVAGHNANGEGQVAISGEAFGSMYGDQINFIVTDTGAGVNFESNLLSDNDIQITADGNITVKDTFSRGSTTIKSRSNDVRVKGNVRAQQRINLSGANIDTTEGDLHSSKSIEILATQDKIKVSNVTSGKVKFAATKKLETVEGSSVLTNNLDIYSGKLVDLAGDVYVNDQFNVNTGVTRHEKKEAELSLEVEKGSANQEVSTRRNPTQVNFKGKTLVAGDTNIEADKITYEGNENASDSDPANNRFTFNNITYSFDLDKDDSGIHLTNSSLSANNVDLDYSSSENFPNKDIFHIVNGNYKVYQNTNIDLNRGGKSVILRTEEQFNRLNRFLGSLSSSLTNINVTAIDIDKKFTINLDKSITYAVDYFKNKGTIESNGSFGIVSKGAIDNSGSIIAAGDLVLNSKEHINLKGITKASGNAYLSAPTIDQEGTLHVGNDLLIKTNKYNLVARQAGEYNLSNDHRTGGTNWNYHSLRKDRFTFSANMPKIDTSSMYFTPAETLANGNIIVKTYDSESSNSVNVVDINTNNQEEIINKEIGKDLLFVKNGRLYAGGSLGVDGDIKVEAQAFYVPIAQILKVKSDVKLTVEPLTLLTTSLSPEVTYKFDNLYEAIEYMLNGDDMRSGIYNFDPMNAVNAMILDREMGPLMQKVFSSIFDADWRQTARHILREKWEFFKTHEDKFKISLVAPKAEVFAQNEISQTRGKLFVGSDIADHTGLVQDRNHTTITQNEIVVEVADQAITPEKINGLQKTSNYIAIIKKSLKRLPDGSFTLKRKSPLGVKPSLYRDISYLNFDDFTKNVGDDGVIAAIVIEQLKDLGGASLTSGDRLVDTFSKLVKSTEEYQRAYYSVKEVKGLSEEVKFKATINGTEEFFDTRKAALEKVNESYDRIDFVKDPEMNDLYVPKVTLSAKTLSNLTNFDKVAASLTGVESFISLKNQDVDVNFGSVNSKIIHLQSDGNIRFKSKDNQFAVNSNQTSILANGDFKLEGNSDFGDLDLRVVGDTTLKSLPFLSTKGDLAQQGVIKANLARIITKNLTMNASKLFAKSDVEIYANDIKLQSKRAEASYYDSITIPGSWSGRETIQSGDFVIGSAIHGSNVKVAANNDLEIQSSEIIAKNTAEISAVNNITTSTMDEHRYIAGLESKVTTNLNAQAQFGSYSTTADLITNLNYNMEGKVEQSVLTASDYATELTTPGTSLAGVGVGFSKEKTHYQHWEETAVNNVLDAKNLFVIAGKDAEIGNTNINSINFGKTDEGEVKTATISAKNVTQTQSISHRSIKITNRGFGVSVGAYATSSIGDLASHIMSAVRAEDMYQHVSPAYIFTTISDVAGLATRDALGVGFRATIGGHSNKAKLDLTIENSNLMSGDLNIIANNNISLKNVAGANLRDINISAKNLDVSAGNVKTSKEVESFSSEVSVDFHAGISLLGPSASASGSFAVSNNKGSEATNTYTNAVLNGRNVNINVVENLNLLGANINGSDEVNIKAKELSIESTVDDYSSTKSGFTGSLTAGAYLVGGPTPYGQIGFGGNHHHEIKHSPSRLAGITSGKKLKIEAEKLQTVGAVIAAEEGTLNVDEIKNNNIQVHEKINGGNAGVMFGANGKKGFTLTANGAQDANRNYNAVIRTTISDNLKIEGAATENINTLSEADERTPSHAFFDSVKYTEKELTGINTNVDKIVAVGHETNYQGTSFSFNFSSTMVKDAKKTIRNIVETTKKVVNSITSNDVTIDNKARFIQPNSEAKVVEAELISPEKLNINARNVQAGDVIQGNIDDTPIARTLSLDGVSNSNHIGEANTIGGFTYGNSDSRYDYYYSNNPGQPVGGVTASNSESSIAILTRPINGRSSSSSIDGYNNSAGTLYPTNSYNLDRNLVPEATKDIIISEDGLTTISNEELSEEQKENLAKQKAKNKYFDKTAISDIRYSTSLEDAGSLSVGYHNAASSSSIATGVQSFDQVASLFSTTTDTNNKNLIYYRSLTQQFGTVFRERNLHYDLNPNEVAGTNAIHAIDLSSIRDFNGTSNLPDEGTIPLNPNIDDLDFTGTDGDTNQGGNNNQGNGFDPTSGNNSSLPDIPVDNIIPTQPEVTPTVPSKPIVKPDGSLSIPETPVPDVDNGKTNVDINKDPTFVTPDLPKPDPVVPDLPPVIDPIPPVNPETPVNPPKDDKPEIADKPSTSDGEEKIVVTHPKEESNKVEEKVPTKAETDKKEKSTPADGNAENGDEIPLDKQHILKKHVIDDLTCYVVHKDPASAEKAIIQQASSGRNLGPNEFENFLRANKPPATLFSTYSKAIVNTLGDSGVICLSSNSDLLQKDFNQVTAADIALAKQDINSFAKIPNSLDVILIVKHQAIEDQIVANDVILESKQKVRFASFKPRSERTEPVETLVRPVIAPTEKIVEIQNKLKDRGIDTNKILILGSKSILKETSKTEEEKNIATVEELLNTKFKTKATQSKLFETLPKVINSEK